MNHSDALALYGMIRASFPNVNTLPETEDMYVGYIEHYEWADGVAGVRELLDDLVRWPAIAQVTEAIREARQERRAREAQEAYDAATPPPEERYRIPQALPPDPEPGGEAAPG